MLARDHLSAIIICSSLSAFAPYPGMITYSSTKSFVNFLGQGLNFELKGKIDCLSWTPAYISTDMAKKPVGGNTISVESAVTSMLKNIG